MRFATTRQCVELIKTIIETRDSDFKQSEMMFNVTPRVYEGIGEISLECVTHRQLYRTDRRLRPQNRVEYISRY